MPEENTLRRRNQHRHFNRAHLDPRFSPSGWDTLPSITAIIPPIAQPSSSSTPPASTAAPPSSAAPPPSSPPVVSSTPSSSSAPPSSAPASSTTPSSTPTPSATLPSVVNTLPSITPSTSSHPTSTLTYIETVISSGVNGAAAASISPTQTATTSSRVSTGVIVGGVVAAILGCLGVLLAGVYFLRKCRRNDDAPMSEEVWNRGDVRRHSAILDDEPMPVRSFERGQGSNSPRPPTMIERSMLSRQPTMPHMYANNGYGGYNDGYGANGYDSQPQSFSPGEFVVTPTSVNPFISQYAQSPMGSPTSSTVPHYNGAYSEPTTPQAAVTRQMSTSQLSRHNTVSDMPGHGTPGTPGPEDPHYVDLSRSSVTPFQAQQYAEISRKLNVPPPAVLGSVSEEEQFLTPPAAAYSTDVPLTAGSGTTMYAQQTGLAQHFSLPAAANANPESPFADPTMFDTSRTHPDSHKQDDNEEDTQDFEAPAGMAALTHNRIASNPPILPEITVQQRAFSPVPGTYDYAVPSSVHNTPSPFHAEFGDVSVPPPAALANRSPLATAPVHAAPEVQPREPIASAGQKRPETTYTLYDEEDAYGGI